MSTLQRATSKSVVAVFNASDDTVEMVRRMLDLSGFTCMACRLADLRRGRVDFVGFLEQHNPHVVVFDISPPYEQNWRFFETLRQSQAMKGRGVVLTTTNKDRLDEVLGHDSQAFDVAGKPYDLQRARSAIEEASRKVGQAERNAIP